MSRRIRPGLPRRTSDEWHDSAADEGSDDIALSEIEDVDDGSAVDARAIDPERDGQGPVRERPSLRGLSVAGFTRRRVSWLIAAALTAWIVIVFARQVGEASAMAADANQARVANAELASNVAALQRELDLIQRPAFIEQQAHGMGLGSAKDHAFTLDPDAPPLGADAPGSASVRLGAVTQETSPLDSWLGLLFGPSPGN